MPRRAGVFFIFCVLMCWAVGATAPLHAEIAPKTSLHDAPLRLTVTHAKPRTRIYVGVTTTLFANHFKSSAVYTARADGTIEVDPLNLFSNLVVVPPFVDRPFDELAPHTVTFQVVNNGSVASQSIQRLAIAADVVRANVREDGLYGTSYMHRSGAPRPGLIVLGGSEGGVPSEVAALFASHGFNALALAYFNADSLPKALANIPIEDVQRAITWLAQQPNTDGSRIGIYGGSKGAELALLAAATFPQLTAVVATKPSSVVFSGLFYGQTEPAPSSWSYQGVPFPYVNGVVPAVVKETIARDLSANRPASYAPEYLAQLKNATNGDAATIPVERIKGPVLLVSGDDDQLWPSSYMAAAIMARLHASHHPFADGWLHYQEAGHGIGVAYDPYMESTGNRYLRLGGTPLGNARASADSWPRILQFLHRALEPQS